MGVALIQKLPGASSIGMGRSTLIRNSWHERVLKTPGLAYHVSAEHPDLETADTPGQFREFFSGAQCQCSTGKPTISASAALGTRKHFNWVVGAATFTDMHIAKRGIPDTFTIFFLLQASSQALQNDEQHTFISNYDAGSKFFLANLNLDPSPAALGVGLAGSVIFNFPHAGVLVAGQVHAIAVTVNATDGFVRLFIDGSNVAEEGSHAPVAYPSGQWFLGGQQLSSVACLSLIGDMLICHDVDLGTLGGGVHLDRLFGDARTYYSGTW